jgi:hypothetical protein
MKLVLVEWDDAYSGNSWEHKENTCEVVKCIAVGVLKSEDERGMEIVPVLSECNKLHSLAIPKGCIKRIRQLQVIDA